MEHFEIPLALWAKMLFDFALIYHRERKMRHKAIEVLIPLYYGMTLSFVNKTEGMSIQQAEDFIEDMCSIFEQTKPYLVDRFKI